MPAFSRPRAPPRYPLPKSLPSGEGLGGRSRRVRALFGRMSRPGHLPPPAASRLPPRGRLGEDPQTPSRHRFPVALAIFRLSIVLRACIGPVTGPIQAKTPLKCPYRSRSWTCTGTFLVSSTTNKKAPSTPIHSRAESISGYDFCLNSWTTVF